MLTNTTRNRFSIKCDTFVVWCCTACLLLVATATQAATAVEAAHGQSKLADNGQHGPAAIEGETQESIKIDFRRIGGVHTLNRYVTSFDRSVVPIDRIEESSAGLEQAVRIEGPVLQTIFQYPETWPAARVLAFYEGVLKDAGYQVTFVCDSADACGGGFAHFLHDAGPVVAPVLGNVGYLPFSAMTALKSEGGQSKYVFVYIPRNADRRFFELVARTAGGRLADRARPRPMGLATPSNSRQK